MIAIILLFSLTSFAQYPTDNELHEAIGAGFDQANKCDTARLNTSKYKGVCVYIENSKIVREESFLDLRVFEVDSGPSFPKVNRVKFSNFLINELDDVQYRDFHFSRLTLSQDESGSTTCHSPKIEIPHFLYQLRCGLDGYFYLKRALVFDTSHGKWVYRTNCYFYEELKI